MLGLKCSFGPFCSKAKIEPFMLCHCGNKVHKGCWTGENRDEEHLLCGGNQNISLIASSRHSVAISPLLSECR